MDLLAWLTGTWKVGAWKLGAWEASGAPPEPPQNPLGGYAAKSPKRRPQEDDEAFLIAVLL